MLFGRVLMLGLLAVSISLMGSKLVDMLRKRMDYALFPATHIVKVPCQASVEFCPQNK